MEYLLSKGICIMANYDSDILIQNIKMLMKDNDITQTKLADILHMPQSNVSKALSENDKKSFTLDQLVGIAKHFRVSIDFLIGNKRFENRDISPRAVAEYFVRLIEHNDISIIKHPVEEEIYEPDYDSHDGSFGCKHHKETVEYNAFFFPSYWYIPYGLDPQSESELYAEMTQIGNDTLHCQTNKFFHQFLQIHALYKQKALEEETYRTVVADLLNHLRN